jgi:hypothetical protein
MHHTHIPYDYTLSDIAPRTGLHFMTVNKILMRVEGTK